MLTIKLIYQDEALGNAWKEDFKGEENVKIIQQDITTTECDAIVSPANSFGYMDGGLDYALSERFGWHLQEVLQEKIRNLDEGELLIGKSITLKTGDNKVPYLISAPTMRVPMSFNIATSVNAYHAMKALLIASKKNDKIKTVAVPGLCTGCGKMPYHIASNQMYLAYDEVIKGNKKDYKSFGDTQKFQYRLNEKGMIWDF
jgi:O-acetyl-ADP-ribose deacetylase (regulator of RNase III)